MLVTPQTIPGDLLTRSALVLCHQRPERVSSGFQISPEMKGRGFNGEKKSAEDRRVISRTYGMKQNLTRYFPAVSSYTPAKDGAAQEGKQVGTKGKRTEIYRAWFPGPRIWLDS